MTTLTKHYKKELDEFNQYRTGTDKLSDKQITDQAEQKAREYVDIKLGHLRWLHVRMRVDSDDFPVRNRDWKWNKENQSFDDFYRLDIHKISSETTTAAKNADWENFRLVALASKEVAQQIERENARELNEIEAIAAKLDDGKAHEFKQKAITQLKNQKVIEKYGHLRLAMMGLAADVNRIGETNMRNPHWKQGDPLEEYYVLAAHRMAPWRNGSYKPMVNSDFNRHQEELNQKWEQYKQAHPNEKDRVLSYEKHFKLPWYLKYVMKLQKLEGSQLIRNEKWEPGMTFEYFYVLKGFELDERNQPVENPYYAELRQKNPQTPESERWKKKWYLCDMNWAREDENGLIPVGAIQVDLNRLHEYIPNVQVAAVDGWVGVRYEARKAKLPFVNKDFRALMPSMFRAMGLAVGATDGRTAGGLGMGVTRSRIFEGYPIKSAPHGLSKSLDAGLGLIEALLRGAQKAIEQLDKVEAELYDIAKLLKVAGSPWWRLQGKIPYQMWKWGSAVAPGVQWGIADVRIVFFDEGVTGDVLGWDTSEYEYSFEEYVQGYYGGQDSTHAAAMASQFAQAVAQALREERERAQTGLAELITSIRRTTHTEQRFTLLGHKEVAALAKQVGEVKRMKSAEEG